MAYLGKVFKFEKHENYDGFIKSLGVPEDKAEILLRAKPSQKLVKNGDTYTLSVITTESTRNVTFKSGVAFDEDIRGLLVKTRITVSGDTLIQVQDFNKKRTFTFKKEFTENTLKETITANFWDGAAYRYYVAS
ncbi:fatty acid-binding protein 1-like [Hyposmocoma kahamanoa]|uniref:fatty acid-binding protein 1-like n=1 Tax=Hyposmocoma kahamanoa TaxID=1477025 RepID=UPI000E6D9670|nr:fatty acid-binding protein 1-like [Hyposmocoma kahamanoa]